MRTFKNPQGQEVGRLIDDVYYTIRKKSGYMIKFGGFGISKNILDELIRCGCHTIIINYLGVKKVIRLKSDMIQWKESPLFIEDKGMGKNDLQIFVPRKDMELIKSQKKLSRFVV
jgi:hypothetical protein